MEIVAHRINLISELLELPVKYGCEIDIRSQDSKLILNHEPYFSGDSLVDYLDNYKHGLLVLNIKEAGIENDVLQLVRERNIPSFFLLDIIACVSPIGIFFGRLANFINSELYGKPTDLPWSVQFIFVDKLAILPIPGYTSPFDSLGDWAKQMALPWLTLAFLLSAIYSRLTRAGMIEVMSEDYVRTARAKGLSGRKINSRHVLRGAITPIVTVFGLDLGALLGGAVITEYVFNIPGLGKLSTDAVSNLDIPVVTGTVLFSAFFVVTANIVVDLIYSALDPKVRLT